jgi:hypothetical protein
MNRPIDQRVELVPIRFVSKTADLSEAREPILSFRLKPVCSRPEGRFDFVTHDCCLFHNRDESGQSLDLTN